MTSLNGQGRHSVIWKFKLDPWSTWIAMPTAAVLRHVGEQDGEVCIWAEVNPDVMKVERRIAIGVTGGPVPAGDYIGTAVVDEREAAGARVVVHIYDTREERILRSEP